MKKKAVVKKTSKTKSSAHSLRKATLGDVKGIQKLINDYAKQKLLLPRSLSYIYDNIRDFYVVTNSKKTIVGCCALHVVWDDLAEIKSLVVNKRYQGKGIGRDLVDACMSDAEMLGVDRVFALTFQPKFFISCDFSRISKNRLPAKVWRECIECHMFPDCDEIAVIKTV